MARMVLDGEWRDSTIVSIGEAAAAALEDVEGDNALTQKIWRARSLATEFANLLCNRPALSAVPVESWTVPHYQRLFNDVSTIEREFRLLGDLDSKAHPAFLTFWFLSQRLQDLLYVATNPLPNMATGDKTTPEAAKAKRVRPRNRKPAKRPAKELTAKQLEAQALYGELNGNMSEVARRMGISHTTAKQHYEAANKKMGIKALRRTTATGLGSDHLGSGVKGLPARRRGKGVEVYD